MMWASLTDALSNTPMGVTAENLAEKYGLTREEVDQFALSSQQKWAEAQKAGNFTDEIAPVELKSKKVGIKPLASVSPFINRLIFWIFENFLF